MRKTLPLMCSIAVLSAISSAGAQVVSGPSPVTTQQVMSALPLGTVLLFDKVVPNPAPTGWEPCRYSGFVRIEQAAPGTVYNGKSAAIEGTTGEPQGDQNWHVSGGHNPPEAAGIHHTHQFSAQLNPGDYFPPAQNFACLHKVR